MSTSLFKILISLTVVILAYSLLSPASSATGTSTSINGNVISVSNTDTITYVNGYYLVGTTWKPFTLSGSLFPGSNVWTLNGASASINISADKSAIGNTTYVLT